MDEQTKGGKNNVALAYPYPVWKSCSKFGQILPSGLGGDSLSPVVQKHH